MQRLQAFRFELMPNGQQERQMRRFAGACRFVYNKALALQKERYERSEKKLGYAGLCKLLTDWRNSAETAWLADAPIHPLQQKLKDLERAYSNFFAKRADFPRFKKKGRSDSFRYPDPKQIKLDQANSRIFLPKLGWVRYRNSRKVLGAVKNVTVSQSCGKWFVSIQTEREVEQTIPQGGAVGIDMGIARFATLSDGTFYAPLNSFKRHEVALRKAQQAMSRTCPCCGHVSADNRQTQAKFECVACGYQNHADVVGAINILSRGMQLWRDEGRDTTDASVGMRAGSLPASARMACGSNRTGGRKQEPTETTTHGAIYA